MRRMRVETEREHRGSADAGRRSAYALILTFAWLLYALAAPACAAQQNAKNVLVLAGGHGRVSIHQMESSLRAHVPWPVDFSVADVDHLRFEEGSYRESLAETFRRGFAGEKIDLVVAVSEPALRFAVQYRDKLFPGAPIVFMSISSPVGEQKMWPGVTGVASASGIRETVDLALRLQPDTNAIAVIAGESQIEKDWWEAVHSELLRHREKVTEIDLLGAANDQMLERVSALPSHTVVLFQLFPSDSNQPAIGVFDVLAAAAQRLPTYSVLSHLVLDRGGIGGADYDTTKDAVLAGDLGARVLSGERPDDIPVVHNSEVRLRVDWRQLRRWNIPESALPPGTEILYREPTFWERERKYMIPGIVLVAAQVLLLVGLLWQRARKQKAEAVLGESEKRFQVMADTTPSLLWMCDARGRITYLNEQRIAFTGPDAKAGYGDRWAAYVHPDDLQNVLDTVSQALEDHKAFSMEYRLRRHDGTYRWMLDVASPRVNGDGSFAGFIGSAIDVTDQKLAQQALEKLSGQLIEAQEKERRRIARELHDDICQRLALLSMKIEQANQNLNGSSDAARKGMEEIQRGCTEIAVDVQSLSHQLHSSVLDFLGVSVAIGRLCNELAKQHDIRIEFYKNNVPEHLSKDISLCLFRVAQEAVHNAVKYSGAKLVTVELTGTGDVIELAVSDEGAGFDVEQARRKGGLGLLSMQERVHLVHGKFSVESAAAEGTRILIVVPLVSWVRRYAEEPTFAESISSHL
jgi:PAS domain S-box-containing protein